MYRSFIRHIIISACCLVFCFGLKAQLNNLGKPFVKNHPREEYKGGTHNWEIDGAQGRKLFANNDGLLSFDGYRWQLYSLPNKSIARSVTVGNNGKIYVGGQDEIGYFSPDPNGILQFNSIIERIPENHRSLEDVWDIEIDGEDIYARSVNKIFIFKADSVKVIDPQHSINFLKRSGDKIYFNSQKNGLYVCNKGEIFLVEDSQVFINKRIVSVVEVNSKLLVFTADDGIFLGEESGFVPWNNYTNEFFNNKEIISAELTQNQHIAIGTALHGIFIFNKKGKSIQHLNKKSGLQNNNILSIYSDIDSSIWTGSSNGIDNIIINNKSYIFPDGEQEGGIYDIAIHDGSIFFGTNNGLYTCPWKPYYDPLSFEGFQLIQESKGQVWGLDTIGNSLFMGHNEGAFIIKNLKAEKISPDAGYWKFIGVDNNSKVIAGGYDGLSLFERVSGKWQFIKRYEGFRESSRLIIRENDKRLWVAHPYRGIFQINFDEDYESIIVNKYTPENGLPSLFRNHVFLIDEKPVFTGESNVYRYYEKQDSFIIDENFEKLLGSDNMVLRLFQDPKDKVWYLTESDFGSLEIDKNILSRTLVKTSFPQLADEFVNGFEELHFNENGNVMIPTESGVIQLHEPINQLHELPEAIISTVKILNHQDSVIYGGYKHGNKQSADSQSDFIEISLKHNQNSLRFEFFSTPFNTEGGFEFNPFIEGIDDDNNNWTSEAYKDYARLPHGNYTFRLSARNKFGEIGKENIFRFTIEPPWHKTKLFYTIYSLVIFLFLAGLILIPRSKYQQQVRVLEDVQEKSKDEIIQLKNEKLKAEIGFKNQQLASSMMHIVQKNEVLNKVKEEAKILKKYIRDPQAEKELKKLISLLSDDERLDEDWEKFTYYFDQVHTDFLRRLKVEYSKLSPKDQKLCAYLRMNLTTKEIAPLLNISVRGVEISRYRLRKKLQLDSSTNLNEFMMNY